MTDTNTTGAYPIDPADPVGLLRSELGDVTPVLIHDPDDGKADYGFVGDAFLAALLAAYPDSPSMALARALGSMATQMIASAQDIQVDDVRIKTVEKANLMLSRARDLETGAANWDVDSAFDVISLSINSGGGTWPQASPAPSGYRAFGESGF